MSTLFNSTPSSIPSSVKTGPSPTKLVGVGVVTKVYLDYSIYNGETVPPGAIEVSLIGEPGNRIAYPFDILNINLPFESENVEIFSYGYTRYYRRIDDSRSLFSTGFFGKIATIKDNSLSIDIGKLTSHRLRLNPGDFTIQSRFGQSIRFSGYNNSNNVLSPTLIIRNNESAENRQLAGDSTVVEDINSDGSTIAITSGNYISSFLPGHVKNGKSNFQLNAFKRNKKYAMESYPKKLDGNQIIISSDRIILSSRINEMIFWAKGSTSIVTDALFSVDALNGMNFVSHDGAIDFVAKEAEINFDVGKGGVVNIGIGTGKTLTKAIDGKALVELIGKMLDEMQNLALGGIQTPAGPTTGLLPANTQRIAELRNTLPSLLSETVWIAK